MEKIVRLTELDLSRIVRRVIKEDGEMCSSKDQKPSKERPLCSSENISSGPIISLDDIMFIYYKDDHNCPKLCRVEHKTKVTLS